MLQADEIIQQKEWQQLTAEEKAVVTALADNEAEFNLLKKMLIVTAEAVSDVPEVAVSVQQKLRASLPAAKKRSLHSYWLAAAAAIIVMAVAALFILKKEDKAGIVNTPEVKKNIHTPVIKEDSLPAKDSTATLAKKETAPAPSKQVTDQKPVFPALQDTTQNNYVMLDASVSNNASLLELVAEVE